MSNNKITKEWLEKIIRSNRPYYAAAQIMAAVEKEIRMAQASNAILNSPQIKNPRYKFESE